MIDQLSFLERNWWLLLIRGLAAIAFGFAAFFWPGLTIASLAILFGIYVLVDGVFGVIDSIRYRDRLERWWLWLLEGVLGVILGALMLFMPGLTALLLVIFVAVWAVFGGVLRIVAAISLRKHIEGEWLLALGGVLSILFGVVVIAVPAAGIISLMWLVGFWALAFGVLFVMLAFRLRRAGRERAAG